MPIEDEAALELAKRSRGTPRVCNRLFKRVRDFALVEDSNIITLDKRFIKSYPKINKVFNLILKDMEEENE